MSTLPIRMLLLQVVHSVLGVVRAPVMTTGAALQMLQALQPCI